MGRGCDGAKARVWRERFLRFNDDGMTIAEFCVAEGVSTASFYAWRRKLTMQDQTTRDQTTPQQKKRPKEKLAGRGVFEPLTIAAAVLVVVRLPGGILIEVPDNSEGALRTIVSQLMRADGEAVPC